jgi:dienelactone hydrolase
MKINTFLVLVMMCASSAMAAIKTRVIDYTQGDTVLEGYLAWDDSTNVKRPVVIVVHEWWGNNDYPHHRAEQLAELGYVGFAIDMYGKGKTTDDPKQAQAWDTDVLGNPTVAQARVQAALETLAKEPIADMNKVAAVGYCFGGHIVLDMARNHDPILGVVAFHGDLSNAHPEQTHDVTAKILVCTGGADAFVPPKAVSAFKDEMTKAGADYKVIEYPGAHHAFTNPAADSHHIDNIKYNPQADKDSWQAMKEFLANLFK